MVSSTGLSCTPLPRTRAHCSGGLQTRAPQDGLWGSPILSQEGTHQPQPSADPGSQIRGAPHPCPAACSLSWRTPWKAPWGERPRTSSTGSAIAGSGTAWKMGRRAESPWGLECHPALPARQGRLPTPSNRNGPAATLAPTPLLLLPCPRLRLEQQFQALGFSGKFRRTDSPRPELDAAAGTTATSPCCYKVPAGPLPRVCTGLDGRESHQPGALADRPAHARARPGGTVGTLTPTRACVCPGFVQCPVPPHPVTPGGHLCILPRSQGGGTEPRRGCPQGSAVTLGVTVTSPAHEQAAFARGSPEPPSRLPFLLSTGLHTF